ncbi:hypothetical protein MP638_004720 [Amoeboaphelidium occidentale]|nr:hypothetical protein MP638_004720 [Amoeboaphelidium occidentale]
MSALWKTLRQQWYEHPAWAYSVFIGVSGLIIGFGVPPIRRSLGYKPVDDPPRTYPYPEKRPYPSGYSDVAPTVR